MDGRIDAHRRLVGILVGDLVVHGEEVAVTLPHLPLTQTADGVSEIQINPQPSIADAATFVADILGSAAGNVARSEVAEGRVHPLQIIVAVALGDVSRVLFAVLLALRNPDPAVVAQRLRHQGELGLVIARHWNAGRMNLRVARIAKTGPALVGAPTGRDVRAAGVGGQIVDVTVPAGRQNDRIGAVPGDFAGLQIADDDALGMAVDHHQVQHLGVGVGLHPTSSDHLVERRVGPEQELLSGLAPRVEGAGDLGTTERPVVEKTTVLAGEGHTLSRALVDDVDGHLGQAMNVGLASAVIAALDGVVEKSMHRVTVVLVVLRGVDAALRGHRMGAARRVVEHEVVHLVAQLGQGR